MATRKAVSSKKKSTTHRTSTVEATASGKGSILKSYKSFYTKLKRTPIVGASIAEFIGTFLLVAFFFSLTVNGSAILVGFALIGIVMIVGGISGAHLNPAVTIGAWVTKKVDSMRAVSYIFAQALGGAVAWKLLSTYIDTLKSSSTDIMSSSPSLLHGMSVTAGKEWYVFCAELIGVTILAYGVAVALRAKCSKTAAALTQGFVMLVALTVAYSLTAIFLTTSGETLTFINPVLAAAGQSLTWNVWPISIYIIAPIIGGVIGFALHDFMQTQTDESCECSMCELKK